LHRYKRAATDVSETDAALLTPTGHHQSDGEERLAT